MEKLQAFLEQRPAIKIQYDHEGTFTDYCRHLLSRVPSPPTGRLTKLILKQSQKWYPDIDYHLLRVQLEKYPFFSSADHAGLLQYGLLVNSNTLFSGMLSRQSLRFQVIISSDRIPLSNISHPRGFKFAGGKFNFFSEKYSHVPFCLMNRRIHGDAGEIESYISSALWKTLPSEQKKFLEFIFFESLNIQNLASTDNNPAVQFGKLNRDLWPLHFQQEIRSQLPEMVYLMVDDLIADMLVDDLTNPDSLLFRILFDDHIRSIYLQEFDGISGCWGSSMGTHFFWGVTAKSNLCPLRYDSVEKHFFAEPAFAITPIPCTPDTILAALNEQRILPSLFIDIMLLTFIEGYTLLGGFNQVTYLAWMRVAHERCMLRLGDWPMAARFARTVTDGLICGPLPFPQWDSGLDLIWHHNSTNGKFNGNLDDGLSQADLDTMMATPMKTLIENGVNAMLDVIE